MGFFYISRPRESYLYNRSTMIHMSCVIIVIICLMYSVYNQMVLKININNPLHCQSPWLIDRLSNWLLLHLRQMTTSSSIFRSRNYQTSIQLVGSLKVIASRMRGDEWILSMENNDMLDGGRHFSFHKATFRVDFESYFHMFHWQGFVQTT